MNLNTDPIRAGIFTSEFIVTLLGGIASFFIANGVVSQTTGNTLLNDLIAVYKGVVALIAIVLIARSYISSRTVIKQTLLENQPKTTT